MVIVTVFDDESYLAWDRATRQESHGPNSALDSSPLLAEVPFPPWTVTAPEPVLPEKFEGGGAGLVGRGCPPDSAPTSVPVCLPDTCASEGELDTGDAGCAEDADGSVACRAAPWDCR